MDLLRTKCKLHTIGRGTADDGYKVTPPNNQVLFLHFSTTTQNLLLRFHLLLETSESRKEGGGLKCTVPPNQQQLKLVEAGRRSVGSAERDSCLTQYATRTSILPPPRWLYAMFPGERRDVVGVVVQRTCFTTS